MTYAGYSDISLLTWILIGIVIVLFTTLVLALLALRPVAKSLVGGVTRTIKRFRGQGDNHE